MYYFMNVFSHCVPIFIIFVKSFRCKLFNCLGLLTNMLQRILEEESNIVAIGVILKILLAHCNMYVLLPKSVKSDLFLLM